MPTPSSPSNLYYYEALLDPNSIRLVVLDAVAYKDAPLSCKIIQRPRQGQSPAYYAISYVWGDCRSFSHTLEIWQDGQDSSFLRINPNVDTLLREFRAPDTKQFLWIDALCLNQDDDIEKA